MTYSNAFEGGLNTIRRMIPLGSGAVATSQYLVGVMPKRGKVSRIRYKGNGAVTGTSLTVEAFVHPPDGSGAGISLKSAATDIAFTTLASARAGAQASFHADQTRRDLTDGYLLRVTITASAITSGPGDLAVEIDFEPR